MRARKPFLFRTEPEVLEALQRWAADELRSVNGQIDYLLRNALHRAGRLPRKKRPEPDDNDESPASAKP